MDDDNEQQGRRLALPEYMAGALVLIMLLGVLCFRPMGADIIEAHGYLNAGFVALSAAVWVNALMLVARGICAVCSRKWPGRFMAIRILVASIGAFLFAAVLGGVVDPSFCWLCFMTSLLTGLLTLVCIGSYIRRKIPLTHTSKYTARNSAYIFLGSLLALVLVSALILMTPGASLLPLPFTDAFFMSASAASNTGLATVPLPETFTWLGLTVLAIDMQLGAMGVMTFTYFVLLVIGRRLAMRDSMAMSSLLDQDDLSSVPALIRTVIFVSAVIELTGAAALYCCWLGNPAVPQDAAGLAGYALFHTVSTFCNSGLTLFPDNFAAEGIRTAYLSQGVMMLIILAGTLGFGVYLEILQRLGRRLRRERNPLRWSTHAWFVLRVTLVLTILGTLSLMLMGIFEPASHATGIWANFWDGLWNCIGRSTGINRVDINDYGPLYKICMMLLMFIGGNPAGTGGGVFAPVFAICVLEVYRELRGERDILLYNRCISRKTVQRAMCTVVLCLLWVVASTMLLLMLEPAIAAQPRGVLDMAFLSVSTFGTSGYSLSDPADLGMFSKYVLCCSMIFGRMGMFTALLIFITPRESPPLKYPETRLPLT